MTHSSPPSDGLSRGLGLYGATMVGVSAMMGAGIFVLSGVALKHAGPAAMAAFALNGVITLVTAFSFAELAAAFPESGGSYVFARKVFPIGGAFAAGWVLWLAYLVAAALYALGFGSFFAYVIQIASAGLGHPFTPPPWLGMLIALGASAINVGLLLRGGAGAGTSVAAAKVVAFLVIVIPGLFLLARAEPGTTRAALTPFLPGGLGGIAIAMGFTFIALEGFEVIAAVGGEVKDPGVTIPRAMFLSIAITLVIYLLLLLVVLALGGPDGGQPAWQELGGRGDQAVAVAVQRFLGTFGTFVVVTAGLLATFSALTSSLLAASRVSFSMARDRALFRVLARLGKNDTPVHAVMLSGGLVCSLVALMGDVEVAGVTSSLIFLLSFALANGAGLLVRVRAGNLGSYQAPLYPVLPLLGITSCVALAVFQTTIKWQASVVSLVWLGLGGLLYHLRFRASAQRVSAHAEAVNTTLIRLRGRTPLVLVPLANPARAEALVTLGNALAPRRTGRVLALSVAQYDEEQDSPEQGVAAYERGQAAVRKAVEVSCKVGRPFEGVVLLAPDVAKAIARTAAEREPEAVLLGMSGLDTAEGTRLLERLMAQTHADVVVVEAPLEWRPEAVRRILVPVGGETGHDPLRARLLGMFRREHEHEVTFLRVLRPGDDRVRAEEDLRELAADLGYGPEQCAIEVSEDAAATLVTRSRDVDLIVLGLGRPRGTGPRISPFVQRIAREAVCPLIAIGHPT
ncbi:MAG: amino acid permease [Planctomycetota bacterium]